MDQEAVRIPIGDWASRSSKLETRHITVKRHLSATGSGFTRNRSKWTGKSLVLPSNVFYGSAVCNNKRHPAVFPLALPSFFIKLLSRKGSLVIDPFAGSGTTGVATLNLGRNVVLIDNNASYCKIARERVEKEVRRRPHQIVFRTQDSCPSSPHGSSEGESRYGY